ncbi:nuclear transport factor 2 family protein [Termitidicoccus mucosus]|uniref:SnoaL-like domain-containing protein n=1 Tax=Termitidicoccus mucosus TaxID=1184151 RepID=A0A178IHL0_9BACT|nr:hypothetical protein AW736_14250 [Opitutaceae bacterium TSB47]
MSISLTPLLAAFVAAHNRHDSAALAACFTDDALVRDEGHEYRGRPAIAAWYADVSRNYRAVLAVDEVSPLDDGAVLAGEVSGDFEGSPVRLRFRFTIEGGKIAALAIAP